MQDLQAMYQEQFANFWAKAFPSESCPPLPKKLEDLGLMKQLALREEDPILFQNLFRSDYSAMPSDVATRLRNNTLWAGDEVVLEKYGWTAKAKEMRAQIDNKAIKSARNEGTESQKKRKKKTENRANGNAEKKNEAVFHEPGAVFSDRRRRAVLYRACLIGSIHGWFSS